jgi:TetR/AcrR family transcriptional repressor of nem operon
VRRRVKAGLDPVTFAHRIANDGVAPILACERSIFGHTASLEADIETARRDYGITDDWMAENLARHTQAVIQGGFVLAKAGDNPELAREGLDNLDRHIRHLFQVTEEDEP